MLKHPNITNDFFQQELVANPPTKEVTLVGLLRMLLGFGGGMMSKRLSPPFTIHNARIYADDGGLLWRGDINLWTHFRQLSRLADMFDQVLYVYQESGGGYVWRSDLTDVWFGYCHIQYSKKSEVEFPKPLSLTYKEFETDIHNLIRASILAEDFKLLTGLTAHFATMSQAFGFYQEYAAKQQRQWFLDHGIAKRTPKEWFKDFKSSIHYKMYDIKWRWNRLFSNKEKEN